MPLSVGELGSHLTQRGLGPGPRPTSVPSDISIHPAVWPQKTWAEKKGAAVLLSVGAGSPSNTMWPGPMPTPVPGDILIHAAVWPQYTNVGGETHTDSQTDNDPTA